MSLFSNMFGKKDKDPVLDPVKSFDDLDSGVNLPGTESQENNFDSFGNPRTNRFSSYEQDIQQHNPYTQQHTYQQQASGDVSKDLQIIIAKLDALRAEVANLSHRLEAVERGHGQQQKKFW